MVKVLVAVFVLAVAGLVADSRAKLSKNCHLGYEYFLARVAVAADRLTLVPMLPQLGQSGLGVTGSWGLTVCSLIYGQCCLYGPMDTEGSVKQAMPGGWLVGCSIGQLGREGLG